MTLEELKMVEESLRECDPDVEYFSWGPAFEFAHRRKKSALKILMREIRNYNKNNPV